MDNKEIIKKLPKAKYLVTFGIRNPAFEAMLEIAYKEMRKRGGRARKLSVPDMLLITLGYYHDLEHNGKQRGIEAENF